MKKLKISYLEDSHQDAEIDLSRLPNAILNAIEKYMLDKQRRQFLADVLPNGALLKVAEDLAQIGNWEIDMINDIIIWSDETNWINGNEVGEIKQNFQSFFIHVHSDDMDSLINLKEKFETQNSNMIEFRIVNKEELIKYINSKIVSARGINSAPDMIVEFNHDITDSRKNELNLINSFKELAKLKKELIEQQLNQQKIIYETTIQAQEKERNELGKELHDNINQILASVKMYLSMAMVVKEDKQVELLERTSNYVNEAMEEIRKLTQTLVAPSLGNISLRVALQELTDEINYTQAFKVILNYDVEQDNMIDSKKELVLYRIAQEQINNICKYAKAKNVTISVMKKSGNILLLINDDGVGFDTNNKIKGIGFKNIQNRIEYYSGHLNIISVPGNGCNLEVSIPI